jgi:hypothetical protein
MVAFNDGSSKRAESGERFPDSLRIEVQGNPLPIGVHIKTETELSSFCSAVTRPVFAWSSIEMPATLLRRRSLIWIPRVIGPVTRGSVWVRGVPSGQLYGYCVKGLSTGTGHRFNSQNCFWIRMQEQSLASKWGFLAAAATIV